MKINARVFSTEDGNSFLIPGFWYSDDDAAIGLGSHTNVLFEGMMIEVSCGLTAEWMEIEAETPESATIEHYVYSINGRQFAHGGIDVLLISGPLFDENHAEAVRTGQIKEVFDDPSS